MTARPSTTTDSDDIAAANSARATMATADFAAFGSWPAAGGAARNRRARKPTLAAALKQAAKAGAKVSGAVIEDGKVTLNFGEQGTDDMKPSGDANPWDEVLSHAANQKRTS